MKAPVILTIIIAAAGSFWGVHENHALTTMREQHRLVLREAAALGVPADSSKSYSPTKATRREREDGARKAKEFADQLVDFAKKMKESEKNGIDHDEGAQKRMLEMIDGILSLSGEELKILIAEMKARTDMDDETRKNMIGFCIMMLAQQHPETAIAIFTESSDLFEEDMMSDHVLSMAITQWAKDQPLAALEWIKRNAAKHPDLVKDETKRAVIAGAAQKDFGLAFQLGAELKLPLTDHSVLSSMARSADTPARQTEFLNALRKQVADAADKETSEKLLATGLSSLFSQVSEAGYEKSMEWIASAKLTESETRYLTEDLSYYQTKGDTGKWLDWMSTQAAGRETEATTRNLVRNWTENDYKAAGEWLAKTPAGPLKETATISYLETVAPYDPEVAAQWAETLTGEKKQDALDRIQQKLKKKDKPAAEEFGRMHKLQSK